MPAGDSDCTVNQLRDVHDGHVVQAGRIGRVTIEHHVHRPAAILDELTDALARAMRNQWEDGANDRRLVQPAPLPISWRLCTAPVAGPVTAAQVTRDGHAPFDPLPGLDYATSRVPEEGDRRALHRVYGGLPSGRLLIVGSPGTGKSSAAILLLLDALRYRDQTTDYDRHRIPVPVLFTLTGWDPDTTPVQDWLTTKLTTDIPLLRGRRGTSRAEQLLRAGRIAVFLDGLDEIPERLRPRALQALSEQATFRLVLLTRTRELVTAAAHHTLVGAVALELLPLRPTDAADYLLRPLTEPAPPPWQTLTTALTHVPDSPLAQALTTPLAVGLLRDIYPATAPVDELLDVTRFPDSDAITDHLLDRAIHAAYTPRPGQPAPRYAPDTAHRALTLIARHLTQRHTHDLAWWTIHTWIPRTSRTLIATLPGALMAGLVVRFTGAFIAALVGALVVLVAGFTGDVSPQRLRRVRSGHVRPLRGLAAGLAAGLAIGLAIGLGAGAAAGLTVGLAFGLIAGLVAGLAVTGATEPTSPIKLWRDDLMVVLMFALVAGLVVGLAIGLPVGVAAGFAALLKTGLVVGLGSACAIGLTGALASAVGRAAVAQIYFTTRHQTPIRLVRFLEDARSRHLLRTVGEIYQFRHTTLQDRLARQPALRQPPTHDPGHHA